MSWVTDKAVIKAAITAHSSTYKELPLNREITDSPESHTHKSYSLRPIGGLTNTKRTSSSINISYTVVLKVIYRNLNTAELDANYDSALSLIEVINGLTGTNKVRENFTFIQPTEKTSLLTLEFNYGQIFS